MRADSDIRRDVEVELRRCPKIDSACIASDVKDGTVTLTGFARSYFARQRAEAALRHVAGIRAIINLIQIEWLVTLGEIKCPVCAGGL